MLDETGYAKLVAAMGHARNLTSTSQNPDVIRQAWKVEGELRSLTRLLADEEMHDLMTRISEETGITE